MATRTCIDLFCGAGGLSLGLERAGFQSILGLDNDRDSCRTYGRAFPHAKVVEGTIVDYDFRHWRGADLVAGGPPCQPFSNGGKRLAAQDHRDMVPEFVRAVNEVMPRVFVMENVAGLLAPRNRGYLNQLLALFNERYIILPPALINAADYGVPQKRTRVLLVGFLSGRYNFPTPTHGPGRARPHVPACKVVDKTTIIGEANPSVVVYAKVPDIRSSPYAGQLFNGGGRPIDLARPAPTVLASAGGNKTHFVDQLDLVPPYHQHLSNGGKPHKGRLEGARRLTVKESALLQTFPEAMTFAGSRSSQYAQIGNAVPPLLSEAIGRSISIALN